MRRAPVHLVVGVFLVVLGVGLGWVLIPKDPPPDRPVREAPSRAEIQRDLRAGETLSGPPEAPFSMRYTDDWRPVDRRRLGELEPEPIEGIQRRDNTSILTVTEGEPVTGGIARLERTLPDTLAERFDDFRLIAIRRVRVPAGPALYVSYVREKSGQVQTLLVVPEGNRRTFQVDAVIRGNAQDTAAQVGAMLGTFDIAGR